MQDLMPNKIQGGMMAIVLYTVDGANNINLFGVEEVAILK
jgi:hypothetical protein